MMDDIPENILKDYRDAFVMFDLDKDGYITPKELAQVMKSLNYDSSETQVEGLFADVHGGRNGKIGFEEFITLMNKRNKEIDPEEEVINAFKVFDREGNGTISSIDLKYLMTTLGDKITEDEIDEMLRDADIDGDGYINYEEFVRMIMNK